MITISLCMIVKNEEDSLARCLESITPLVDEIVIVDTGSTDATKEIAAKFTDRVYDFTWIEDFSAARNFAFSKATKEYLLWLDADDVILPEDAAQIQQLKETLEPDIDMVYLKYNTGFDPQGNVTFSYYRERLVRSAANFRFAGVVHEAISPRGKTQYCDAAVTHRKIHVADSERNLRIYEHLLKQGGILPPRDRFYYARELFYHQRFSDAVAQLEVLLQEPLAWIENKIEGCRLLANCHRQLGNSQQALWALLRSLEFDQPRAEICCDIGHHWFHQACYPQAIFWYKAALSCTRNDKSGGFVEPDCYGYLPAVQLCVCNHRLGNMADAKSYHVLSGQLKPQGEAFLFNKQFFDTAEVSE